MLASSQKINPNKLTSLSWNENIAITTLLNFHFSMRTLSRQTH